MATIILQVSDESLVSKVKQACKMLMGVTSVKLKRETKRKTMDVTQTAGYKEAMDDIAHNRITHHNSVDDMFRNILGESALQKIRINHV